MASENRGDGEWKNYTLLIPTSSTTLFNEWATAYHPYLYTLYSHFLKMYKGSMGRYITFREFTLFAYKTSSKYISKFV